jgi:5'-phosphate synthase pdxT subunit
MSQTIGILALQGAFAKHEERLRSLNANTLQIKTPEALQKCAGLIIPGGESTTLTKLMRKYGFYEPLREFGKTRPVMGTCAGMIMLATQVDDERVAPLQLMNISVSRNAYGRQVESFITHIDVPFLGNGVPFRSIFIRAPQIREIGLEVETLIEFQGKPVMVQQENILAVAFHPELTDDLRIHQYFLEKL